MYTALLSLVFECQDSRLEHKVSIKAKTLNTLYEAVLQMPHTLKGTRPLNNADIRKACVIKGF